MTSNQAIFDKAQQGTPATGYEPQPVMALDRLLSERASTHGDYSDHASFTQQIKHICHGSKNWEKMNSHQRETLDMIAHKIGRILAGDPHFDDHWKDISGYAKLTADRLIG